MARHALRTTTLPVVATCRTAGAAEEATRAALLRDGAGTEAGGDAEAEARGSRLTVVPLDVTDEASVAAAAARATALFPPAAGWRLHLGLALPGVLHPEKSPGQVRYDAALETLRVNTLGPLVLIKWFGDLLPTKGAAPSAVETSPSSSSSFRLPAHATWLTASARVGSTADNRLGGWYSYRASKAGVASLTKTFDLHLRQRCGDRALAVAYRMFHPIASFLRWVSWVAAFAGVRPLVLSPIGISIAWLLSFLFSPWV